MQSWLLNRQYVVKSGGNELVELAKFFGVRSDVVVGCMHAGFVSGFALSQSVHFEQIDDEREAGHLAV